MKKIFSLLGLLMLLCSSAFAQVGVPKVIYERGGSTAWSDADLESWTHSNWLTLTNTANGLQAQSKNGTEAAVYSLNLKDGSIVEIEAEFNLWSNTGRYISAENGSFFRFGNIYIVENDQDKKSGYSLDGFTSHVEFSGISGYRPSSVDAGARYYLTMRVNTATNTLESLEVAPTKGAATVLSLSNVLLTNPDYSNVAIGYKKNGSMSTNQLELLRSIKITEIEQDVTKANYTISYQLSGKEIKSESSSATIGNTVVASSSFYVENQKYYAVDGAQTEFEVASSGNNFVVPVREANNYSYTVTSNNVKLASGTGFEGETVVVAYPQFYLDGTTLYETQKTNDSKKQYNISVTLDENDKVATVASSQKATGVVYYKEGENIDGFVACTGSNVGVRCSNSAAGSSLEPVTITNLPAGVYNIAIGEYDNSSSNHHTIKFTAGNQTFEFATTSVNQNQKVFENVILSEATDFVFNGVEYLSNGLDYIYVQKTADFVATESLTIADATPEIGKAATLAATIAPANASSKTITWSLDEASKEYAELNAATGELTPLKAGDITIKATNGEKEVEKVITIAPAEFAVTITGAPSEAQVFVGDDASAKDVLSVTTKAGYDQMQNTSLLQPQGSVTATKIPTYIYSITVDKTKKTVDVVYEEDIEVTAMSFEVTDQRIALGNSRTLQVTYYPADASFKTATWTSSNPEVATVDANTGLVTAVSEGETTITATWSENESHGTDYSAQLTLTVDKGLVIDRIVFDELDDATAEVMGYYHPMDGDTLFLAPLIESNGRMIPVSFIKQEAFIGSNLKSIVIPGTVKTIDHRALMYSNTHNAYEELPEDGLESAFLMEGVEVMRDRIFHGNKYMKKVFLPSTLTDIGYYSFFGTAIEDVYFGGSEDEWNALKNLENAKLPETAKIHFNSDFTSAFINSIEVEEESVEIAVGETYAIEATVIPESIAPAIELTYTSSNEEVATVDEEGVVTGIADGYVTITVSAGEGVEAKVRVKVGDPVQERENVLTMDFEDGEVADYWALAIAESQLVEPTAEGSTGRAAAVVSGSDRGDYVKVNADLEGATKYEVAMDLLLTKSPKTTQFCVLNASSWDTWTTNWGMFWKDTKAQSHNPFLFNLDIAGNSNTANVNIDFDADGNAIAAQQTWDFENGVWYTLTLAVDVNAHKVDYTIAAKSDPETALISGTYNAPADENMQIKGIYERNGRYNYSPGAIAIDNVIVDVTERGFVEGQGGNGATGISEAQSNESTVKSGKYMENGQIVIYIDGKKFNAAGQQMK